MDKYIHLPLPEHFADLNKRKSNAKPRGPQLPKGRIKSEYYTNNISKANQIARSFQQIKEKFQGKIHPKLIYRIKVNQSVDVPTFEKTLNAMGGISVLSVAENRQGYWVVFANDEELNSFKTKIAQYSGMVKGAKYDFFNAIDGVEDIPIEDKIGLSIKENPLTEEEYHFLDVELWRMDDQVLMDFIKELKQTYSTTDEFRITDQLIMRSFALLRIKMSKRIFDEIVQLREIAKVDRPIAPLFKPFEYKEIDVDNLETFAPDNDATGILIVDSGIVSNHPLLEKAVGAEENFQEGEKATHDIAGHGTAVAGNAIYGNIDESIHDKSFRPSNWLFSAKVMYAQKDFNNSYDAVYDPDKLIESQFNNAIRSFLDNPQYKIKAVNVSFGNRFEIFGTTNNRQFPLANLIDELALEYRNVVFVVSAGNQNPQQFYSFQEIIEEYPDYLTQNPHFKIINPASSALSLTVGSIATPSKIFDTRFGEDIWHAVAKPGEPSPFSRAGFGINGMVKPELVGYGGNIIVRENFGRIVENIGGKIPLLHNSPTEQLFAFDYGTSFAAPKITNIIGKITNLYPNKSANFIKNLILQSTNSTTIPKFNGSEIKKEKALLQMTGYGLPDYDRAIYSYDNRVVLFDEGEIGLNKIKVFSINIPTIFFSTQGYKKISVVLTFDPPVRATRGDSYLGNRLEFKLFHSVLATEVANSFGEFGIEDVETDDSTPDVLKPFEIVLNPGANTRKAGCHQKAWKEYKREPKNAPQPPISLVLMNLNKWIKDENHKQNYCLSLIIEHSQDIQIYNTVRTEVQQRVRIR